MAPTKGFLRGLVLQAGILIGLFGVRPIRAQGDTLGLGNGFITLETANFNIELVHDAQVLASLRPKGQTFDFLPFDYLPFRAGNNQYHWGDVTIRYRETNDITYAAHTNATWVSGDSSLARSPVTAVLATDGALAASNLLPTLPLSDGLSVTREWLDVDGDLALRFNMTNGGNTAVEIGSLGFPAEFDSIFTGRTAEEIQQKCSLSDPYIGMHAGYIRVSPVNGNGAALVVTALDGTDTPMEAYRNLDEPSYNMTQYYSQTFEGFYEWQMLTKAWAENEWNASQPWNTPSSRVLEPGQSIIAGLRFSLVSAGIRGIEDVVRSRNLPLARGVPGYIVPNDLTAQLLVYTPPEVAMSNITVNPEGSLAVSQIESDIGRALYQVVPSASVFGRARLTISYTDSRVQTVHYYVKRSGPETVSELGQFLTNEQWFTDTSDPFGRAPSVLSYDYQAQQFVTQDDRVWIAGLSDEAGAGSFLAAVMKQAAQPNSVEISKLETFVDEVMWEHIQTRDDYSVRKSIFFYQQGYFPGYTYSPAYNWSESWNESAAYLTIRAYDYVHVTASYWALYRASRAYPTLFTHHEWTWYLNQSYTTVMTCMATDSNGYPIVEYSQVGLMEETVFGELLADLQREGWDSEAASLEASMRSRAALWNMQAVPFGSEMAWDSTGQEGVYYWSKYFGYNSTAQKALDTVIGYMPTVAHWGWNGNARRYWDNLYGGKLRRIERQIHHYGSGLNALVALSAFRSSPNDTYLLRIGYGGMNGPLSNVNAAGFASASFHSFPETLAWDAYSGDYGPNFAGLVMGSAAYLAEDPDLGLVVYGGLVISNTSTAIVFQPRDAVRRKIYLGPSGVQVTLDSGVFEEVMYNIADRSITVVVSQLQDRPQTVSAILWTETEFGTANYTVVSPKLATERLGWRIPLGSGPVTVVLIPETS